MTNRQNYPKFYIKIANGIPEINNLKDILIEKIFELDNLDKLEENDENV